MTQETSAPAAQVPAPDPLEHAARLREDLESLRAVSVLMSCSLVDESVRKAFKENLARAELDVAAAERQGREEHRRRSEALLEALERRIGRMVLDSTGLSWDTFSIGGLEAFLDEASAELVPRLQSVQCTLAEAEAALGVAPPSQPAAPAASQPSSSPSSKLVADCEFVSAETVSQCDAAGIATLEDAAGFTEAELSALGLTKGALIQLSSLLEGAGLSFAAPDKEVR